MHIYFLPHVQYGDQMIVLLVVVLIPFHNSVTRKSLYTQRTSFGLVATNGKETREKSQ